METEEDLEEDMSLIEDAEHTTAVPDLPDRRVA
jgi:hypothetical protein